MSLKRITGKLRLLRSSCETKSTVNCLFPRLLSFFFLPEKKGALLYFNVVLYRNTFFSRNKAGETISTWSVVMSMVSHNYLIDFVLWKSGRRRYLNKENCLVLLFFFRKVIYLKKVNETIPDRLEMIKTRFYLEGSLM